MYFQVNRRRHNLLPLFECFSSIRERENPVQRLDLGKQCSTPILSQFSCLTVFYGSTLGRESIWLPLSSQCSIDVAHQNQNETTSDGSLKAQNILTHGGRFLVTLDLLYFYQWQDKNTQKSDSFISFFIDAGIDSLAASVVLICWVHFHKNYCSKKSPFKCNGRERQFTYTSMCLLSPPFMSFSCITILCAIMLVSHFMLYKLTGSQAVLLSFAVTLFFPGSFWWRVLLLMLAVKCLCRRCSFTATPFTPFFHCTDYMFSFVK